MAGVEFQSLIQKHSAFDGKVIFHMMPYTTYSSAYAVDEMDAAWFPPSPEGEAEEQPDATLNPERTSGQTIYLSAPYSTIDIEFADELPVIAQALQIYWNARTGDAVENYERFQMLPIEIVNLWWDAYLATRNNSIYANGVAPEAQTEAASGEDTDPEAQAASD